MKTKILAAVVLALASSVAFAHQPRETRHGYHGPSHRSYDYPRQYSYREYPRPVIRRYEPIREYYSSYDYVEYPRVYESRNSYSYPRYSIVPEVVIRISPRR